MKENIAKKYTAMQEDFEKKVNTGKTGNLTLSDLLSIGVIAKELLKKHVSKTCIKNIADYFKSFGFMVTPDFDKINYVIVEV